MTTGLIGDINTFLSSNVVNNETVKFLIELKQRILEGCDEEKTSKTKNSIDLEKTLRSIGKKAFVNCYNVFKQQKNGEIENIVDLIKKCGGTQKDNSVSTKASIGKKIFNANMELEALRNIIASNKVPEETKNKALKILQYEQK